MGKFKSLAPSEKPHRVFIKLDGKQIADKNGNPFYVDVHADDGPIGRRFDKEWRDRLLEITRAGREQPTQEDHNRAKCAALTAAWHVVDPETLEPMDEPCNRENVLEAYETAGPWLWGQVYLAALSPANFIKHSAKSSLHSQSGNSETVAS
jgi:hypothetical protein